MVCKSAPALGQDQDSPVLTDKVLRAHARQPVRVRAQTGQCVQLIGIKTRLRQAHPHQQAFDELRLSVQHFTGMTVTLAHGLYIVCRATLGRCA